MAEPTPQDIVSQLQAGGFSRTGPVADTLSDPIADTLMRVTLDQLRPYDLNPRVTRNPRHDEIKASIRERGLDAPPPITRRPTDTTYMIRNGGNTRLAILRELWTETQDERFFRIACLFRPWTARGEIVALTGHLAENELHGGLTLIERALGIDKARTLYEQEKGESLSQSALARRLTADGYPISQSHLSRLQDAVRYLLPAIPNVLYAGLGRPQVERLAALRKAGERLWNAYATDQHPAVDFPSLFKDVVGAFDSEPDTFSVQRVQDELIGQMAELLNADYDVLALALDETERRHRVLSRVPTDNGDTPRSHATQTQAPNVSLPESRGDAAEQPSAATDAAPAQPTDRPATASHPTSPAPQGPGSEQDPGQEAPIVLPTPTSGRPQSVPPSVDDKIGDEHPIVETTVLRSVPVQADGRAPIADVWFIEPELDTPGCLRSRIAQLARDVAAEADAADYVESVDDGIGFICRPKIEEADVDVLPRFAQAVLALLYTLSAGYRPDQGQAAAKLDAPALAEAIGALLVGEPAGDAAPTTRLSDDSLLRLFRLLRLARRLWELDVDQSPDAGTATAC